MWSSDAATCTGFGSTGRLCAAGPLHARPVQSVRAREVISMTAPRAVTHQRDSGRMHPGPDYAEYGPRGGVIASVDAGRVRGRPGRVWGRPAGTELVQASAVVRPRPPRAGDGCVGRYRGPGDPGPAAGGGAPSRPGAPLAARRACGGRIRARARPRARDRGHTYTRTDTYTRARYK